VAQAGWMGEVYVVTVKCGRERFYLEIYLARVVGDCVLRSEYRC